MNLKNISRDSFWTGKLDDYIQSWSSHATNQHRYSSDGAVYQDVGTVKSNGGSIASGFSGIGVQMDQPLQEHVPYRVKVYVPTDDDVYLGIGYADASPTGTDDTINSPNYYHLIGELDEIFMINNQESGDTYDGRSLVFGIFTANTQIYYAHLSVQKLDVVPPQFGIAVP
jgi:hypothetical protein